MSAQHTPGPLLVGSRQSSRLIQFLLVPAAFWDDHADRCPSDDGDKGLCYVSERKGRQVLVYGDWQQIECLRIDAQFYVDGNVDDSAALVRSAKATIAAIAKATGSTQ